MGLQVWSCSSWFLLFVLHILLLADGYDGISAVRILLPVFFVRRVRAGTYARFDFVLCDVLLRDLYLFQDQGGVKTTAARRPRRDKSVIASATRLGECILTNMLVLLMSMHWLAFG